MSLINWKLGRYWFGTELSIRLFLLQFLRDNTKSHRGKQSFMRHSINMLTTQLIILLWRKLAFLFVCFLLSDIWNKFCSFLNWISFSYWHTPRHSTGASLLTTFPCHQILGQSHLQHGSVSPIRSFGLAIASQTTRKVIKWDSRF